MLFTKKELLQSHQSLFSHVYEKDKYIIAQNFISWHNNCIVNFELAVQRLIVACFVEPTLVPTEQDDTQLIISAATSHKQ